MSLKQKQSKTVQVITEEAVAYPTGTFAGLLSVHGRAAREAKLQQISEFIKLLRSDVSVENLAQHPLWSERKLFEWIDGAEIFAMAHGDR